MSHFADYYLEERRETVIENEKGFITYRIFDPNGRTQKECMICDFFVAKKYRGGTAARDLANQVKDIAVENKCTHLSCYIQHLNGELDSDKTTYKVRTYAHYGFKILSMNETQITMFMDIKKEN